MDGRSETTVSSNAKADDDAIPFLGFECFLERSGTLLHPKVGSVDDFETPELLES